MVFELLFYCVTVQPKNSNNSIHSCYLHLNVQIIVTTKIQHETMLKPNLIPFSYGCFVEDFYCIEFVFSFVLGKKNLIGQSKHENNRLP